MKIQLLLGNLINSLYKYVRFNYHKYRERQQYGKYEFPYREELGNIRVYVLANGPSLKKDMADLLSDKKFLDSDKFVLNFFANSDYYTLLKPKYYCLADKGFFIDNYTEGHTQTLEALNQKTNWQMSLYVPNRYYKIIRKIIVNPSISIVPLSTLQFEGFEKKRYYSYKKGIAVPCYVNVVIMIEYILLNMGCKDIWLYGVDHTFFTNMVVNEENHVGYSESHFYGEEFVELKDYDGSYLTICSWLMDKYLTFKEHENMRGYAGYLGARIVNCTKGSLIDAYVRLAQLEKEDKQDKV